jgi:hypothetical protein
VFQEGDRLLLRPYIKDGRKYNNVLFTGTPEQFMLYNGYNMKDLREGLIKEAFPLAVQGNSREKQRSEYSEKELKKFKKSAEETNIPGYSLDSEGKRRFRALIDDLDSDRRRAYWLFWGKQYGIH